MAEPFVLVGLGNFPIRLPRLLLAVVRLANRNVCMLDRTAPEEFLETKKFMRPEYSHT